MSATAWRWLIRDVFVRARSTGFEAAIIAAISLISVVCLTVNYDDGQLSAGGVGLVHADSPEEAVRQFVFALSIWVADVGGLFVVLVATAGFLPAFLEPAAATVLLSKPLSRGQILLGRFAGMWLFVALHAGLFVVGTALAVRSSTGVWLPGYLMAWPLLMVQFTAFAAVGALIAICTRSTVAVMLGSVAFAIIAWGISFGRHFLTALTIDEAAPGFGRLVNYAYWLLPKPTDCGLMMHDALGVPPAGLAAFGLKPVLEQGLYSPGLAIGTTLTFAFVVLCLAVYELNHQDY